MPFYTPSKDQKHQIDFNKYKPIYAYFYTDKDGKIKPLKFKYESDDSSLISLDIDNIKYSKDIQGGILFCCLVTNYGRQQEVDIVYFYAEHQWCLVIA